MVLKTLRSMFSSDPHANLKRVVGATPIPSFPASIQRVQQALRDPSCSMATVGDRIAADPGLSIDVLKLANSAAYGLRRPVSDPAHAARLLGRSEVEALVLGIAVRDALPGRIPGFDAGRFWHTAARRAALAAGLAQRVQPRVARLSFTAGLLQDLAVPLLAHANPQGYRQVLATQRQLGGRLDHHERRSLGWDHAMVAGWLCEAWVFPQALALAIAGHHDDSAPAPVQVAAELDDDLEPMVEAARQRLGLPADTCLAVLEEADDRAHQVARLFS